LSSGESGGGERKLAEDLTVERESAEDPIVKR
jgi:hypothetical protein